MSEQQRTTRDQPGPAVRETTRDSAAAAGPSPTTRDDVVGPSTGASTGGLPEPVFQKYRPERNLGAGGEAQRVMLVADRTDGSHHVVKVYGTAIRPDPDLLKALKGADSDHVVGIEAWGDHVDEFGVSVSWEVMEYVEYGSLRRLIGGRTLAPELVTAIVKEITVALRYLHQEVPVGTTKGLAHRDVKPENILVRDADNLDLVLCDFGLIAEIRGTRLRSSRAGTAAYQAPETWWGKSKQAAQDWWSLGVIVAEMLLGHNPNSGVDNEPIDDDLLFEQIATRGVDLSGVTDPRWRSLCRGLLIRDPDLRWGADEVTTWLDGDDVEVPSDEGTMHIGPARRAAVPPLELAGRVCRTPRDVARALGRDVVAAHATFLDRQHQLDLADWLAEHFPDTHLPKDLMRTVATDGGDAARRAARFCSHVAPEDPPVFHSRTASAEGIAAVCADVPTDLAARRFVAAIDPALLRIFSRHTCTTHRACVDGGGTCQVLDSAAESLAPGETALRDRIAIVEPEARRGGAPRAADQAQRLRTEDAVLGKAGLLLCVLAPGYLDQARANLANRVEAARCSWWRGLRDEAARPIAPQTVAAAVLATVLADAATEVSVREEADRAHTEQIEATRRSQERRDRRQASLREARAGIGRDLVSLLLALVLGYLTTYMAALAYQTHLLSGGSRPAELTAAQITSWQIELTVPLVILLVCALLRPTVPATGARWAVFTCVALAAAAALTPFAGRGDMIEFPLEIPTYLSGWLGWLNAKSAPGAGIFALFVALPLSVYLARLLIARGRATPRRQSNRWVVRVRRVVLVVALILLALQPAEAIWGWQPTLLPFLEKPWIVL